MSHISQLNCKKTCLAASSFRTVTCRRSRPNNPRRLGYHSINPPPRQPCFQIFFPPVPFPTKRLPFVLLQDTFHFLIEHFVDFWRALRSSAQRPPIFSQHPRSFFSHSFPLFPRLHPNFPPFFLLIYIKFFIKHLYEKLFTLSTRFSTIVFPIFSAIFSTISKSEKSKARISTHFS